ncbi:MAG: hypothetical protein AUI33_05820 [Ignavibacteria bacterium 13_1_40CM_2_61_4]|nr:MAG: hypothetical protein AUI33_05820 [Ignavibacteria bacterium 13_1_40CM_2_61_4]
MIHSRLFSVHPNLRFGLSTRRGGASPEPFGMNLSFKVGDDPLLVRQNRNRFFEVVQIPQDRLAVPSQVHSGTVLAVTSPGRYDQCDGLVSSTREIFLAVSVADCLPVFLFDPVTMTVAAVHAGWRGTRLGILSNALKILFEDVGSRPENLLAYLGPSAAVCCYEVGEDVAEQFDPAFVTRRPGRKPRLDLKAANRAVLTEAGVPDPNIEVSEYCTICNPALFHSYRREGAYSGRMIGVLGLIG